MAETDCVIRLVTVKKTHAHPQCSHNGSAQKRRQNVNSHSAPDNVVHVYTLYIRLPNVTPYLPVVVHSSYMEMLRAMTKTTQFIQFALVTVSKFQCIGHLNNCLGGCRPLFLWLGCGVVAKSPAPLH